jgi:poly(3-hydroxybutyrate) depolymerase
LQQWFDMDCVQKPYLDPEKRQTKGLRQGVEWIRKAIAREAREVGGFDKIFLGGMGQGCAMAITACLAVQKPLAGIIAFSGWCPFANMEDLLALVEWLHNVVDDLREPDTSICVENTRLGSLTNPSALGACAGRRSGAPCS